jgi:minor extracellular serine protease Vpr
LLSILIGGIDMLSKSFKLTLILVLIFSLSFSAVAQQGEAPDRFLYLEVPSHIQDLKLDSPLQVEGISLDTLSPGLFLEQGPQEVIVRLISDSGADAFAKGLNTSTAKRNAVNQQNAFINTVRSLDPNARVVARVQMVLNAVFIEVDASVLPQLALDPRVVRIAPVGIYEMDLSETVPYIGASAVQDVGFDGSGIKVAVLDSGIDYTHAALGGSGDPEEYAQNDPTIIEPGTFPTAKVVGGYDFVGELWPDFGPLQPDPDPIDLGGHGTHVAHIIGGDGGVAPGVDLYAVKVCSSVSTACSGIALIQGMDFALDPNGDGRLNDRVDIINMSLGASYGQPFDNDLSAAVDNATKVGVLTVAAAGNSADKPYASGTPSSADTALSVAQTSGLSNLNPWIQVSQFDPSIGS